LTQQQKEQIKKEITAIGDSMIARIVRFDPKWLDYFVDSTDWGMANNDGTRWDYQYTKKVQPDYFNLMSSFKWTTIHQDFKFLAKDIVLYAWDGKDETILKSGDKITNDPHTYTVIFKNIEGQWKPIYSHDSSIPVTQKADQK
jgi:hypothetical protein